jgi:hypothetical protein
MKLAQVNTRFMQGNKDIDGVVADIMIEKYGFQEVIINSGIDFDNAIYSNGFISAIKEGLVPEPKLIEIPSLVKGSVEFHHVIIGDECYAMYFN